MPPRAPRPPRGPRSVFFVCRKINLNFTCVCACCVWYVDSATKLFLLCELIVVNVNCSALLFVWYVHNQ